jgi:hypothetical protein
MSATTAADNQRLGEPLWFLHNRARILVDGEESEERFSLVEMIGASGDMPPLHVHHEEDETFYVIDGELELHIADASRAWLPQVRPPSPRRECRTPTGWPPPARRTGSSPAPDEVSPGSCATPPCRPPHPACRSILSSTPRRSRSSPHATASRFWDLLARFPRPKPIESGRHKSPTHSPRATGPPLAAQAHRWRQRPAS